MPSNHGVIDGMIGLMRCFLKGHELGKQEKKELSLRISKFLENSKQMKRRKEGDLEWGLDESTRRLVFKRKGSLEDYVDGDKVRPMKDYDDVNDAPWIRKYQE